MNSKLAAGLLVVVVLVGLVLFFFGTGGRESSRRSGAAPAGPSAPVELSAPPDELVGNPVTPAAPAPVAVQAERSAVEPAGPGSLRAELAGLIGRVVESDGTPVAGIRVALLGFQAGLLFDGAALGQETPSIELEETVTDAAGKFLLGGANQHSLHGLGVDLGGPRSTLRVIDRTLVHRERTDLGDVVLAPFGVLTGRITDERGGPLAGARVRCGPFPAEILQAHPEEFRSDSLVAINRVVMGGEGYAILELPGWIRSLLDRLPVPTTLSASDGTFRLAGVALSQVVGSVDLREHVGVSFGPLDMSSGSHDLGTLVLKDGRTVRGVVEDSSGEPVAGAEVHAAAEIVPGMAAILRPCGTTDEEGRFELGGVAETGQVVATARRSPQETWSTTVSARTEGVLIEMEPTVSLTVNVRDDAGQPLPGADIRLAPGRQSDANMGFADALALLPKPPSPRGTFAEVEPGKYTIAGIGAGRYRITAHYAGRAPGFLEADCLALENEVTVVCPLGKTIELSVVDAATREPIAGARASLLRAASSGFAKLGVQLTDAGGRARLGPISTQEAAENEDFFPSQTILLVEHPRHGDHSAALDPDAATLVVELHAGGALAGRVHWAGAVPTQLYMLTLEYRDADDFLELFHVPRFVVTDLAGEFRTANLGPGRYGVSLTDRFLQQDPLGLMAVQFEPPTLYKGEIEIRDGETTELVIDLTPTGRGATARVVGRVRFEGRSLAGAKVNVSGNENVEVTTDERGRFETPAFSVLGTTRIRIEGDVPLGGGATRHLQLHQESVELTADAVHEVELDLYPLTVRARVIAEADGGPVSAAEVSAQLEAEDEDEREYVGDAVPTNGAGEVELIVLEPGSYRLNAHAEGFTRSSCTVKVSADGSSEQGVLRLQRAVACAGRVQAAAAGTGPGRFSYLWVQSEDGANTSGTRIQQPDYTFELEELPPGKYTAHIYLDGQQGQAVTFELGKDGDEDLVLEFTPQLESEEEE